MNQKGQRDLHICLPTYLILTICLRKLTICTIFGPFGGLCNNFITHIGLKSCYHDQNYQLMLSSIFFLYYLGQIFFLCFQLFDKNNEIFFLTIPNFLTVHNPQLFETMTFIILLQHSDRHSSCYNCGNRQLFKILRAWVKFVL